MSQEPGFGEQAISQVVEKGLASQLSDAEELEVKVHTDLLNAVQGNVDSASVAGKGVVVQPDIRVEEIELQVDRISINPLSAVLGQLRLEAPVNSNARIVLTEADLNRALNSDFVRDRLRTVLLELGGKPVSIDVEPPMSIDLQTPDKMGFIGTLLIDDPTDGVTGKRRVGMSASFCLQTASHPVLLESFCCTPGQGVTLPFAVMILQKVLTLIQSPYLKVGEMTLRVKAMAIESGSLILRGEAQVLDMART